MPHQEYLTIEPLNQVPRGRKQIFDIARKASAAEFALARAQPCEVKPK